PIRHLDLCRHFFVQAEDGIRDRNVTGVQTCALPISEQGLKHRLTRSRSDLGYTSVIDSTVRRKAYDRTMSITVMILSGGRSRRRSEERRVGKGCRAGVGTVDREMTGGREGVGGRRAR